MLDDSLQDGPASRRSAVWALRSRRVVTPSEVRDAAVIVSGEKIVAVVAPGDIPASCPMEDALDRVVLPGLVDAHVHINEPGRTEWEGFETATRAAAAGGITSLIDMPLNSSPVTITPEALTLKLQSARGKLWVDCGFYGGIVPGVRGQIGPLVAAGVMGFKAFLCHSGIDEFPNASAVDLTAAMPELACAGVPLLVHAELTGPPRAATSLTPLEARSYARYLASRPREWEHNAIRLLIGLCRETGCRVHIVHLSSADALPMIALARSEGLPLFVETCPHYLVFAAEEIPDGDPRYKCAPPIRERENRERLWAGLRDGLIDTIGTDHSPAPPALKHLDSGDLDRAWGGIASLQVALPAVWTEAHRRGFTLGNVTNWMARRPAELLGIATAKGAIAPGCDADLVVFDPDATFSVDPAKLHDRHRLTPYDGRRLTGVVEATYLRGSPVYRSGTFEQTCSGRPLSRRSGFSLTSERSMDLETINAWTEAQAIESFRCCCGSSRWYQEMARLRPFESGAALREAADRLWWELGPSDWLEAFAAHPRIGARETPARGHAAAAAWSAGEQAGTARAPADVLQALEQANRRYETRFGHIFIVCATGKSAEEMLAILERRLSHSPEDETKLAAAEQAKITRIRLEKLAP